jgi:NAD+-dependent protein deacetylase sirtuin 4
MRYQEFVGSGDARARYWARSMRGWPRFREARPNPAHHALARMEAVGVVKGVITQNVDGLHQRAGSTRVLELHGGLDRVVCLECGGREARADLQARLSELNPGFRARVLALAADGDADLPAGAEEGFRVPACRGCGGVLKPDVVFFGENVPGPRVDEAWRLFERGDVLLVVGSSLTVYSGRRFAMRAVRDGIPMCIVNMGPTRSDEGARIKVEGPAGTVLPELARRLNGG